MARQTNKQTGSYANLMPTGCSYVDHRDGIRVFFQYTVENADGSTKRKQKSKCFQTQGKGRRELKREIAAWHEKATAEADKAIEQASLTYRERERERIRKTDVCDFIEADIRARRANGSIEESTARAYRNSLSYIRERFEGVALEDVTAADVRAFEADLSTQGFSASTVTKAHRLLKYALQQAVIAGYIDRNPMLGIKPPKRKRNNPSSLDQAGVQKLLRAMRERGLDTVTVSGYIALKTGMRCGEVCGLKWSDVELQRDKGGEAVGGWVTARRAIGVGTGEEHVKATKTDRVRDIPVSPDLARVLDKWRAKKAEECMAAGASLEDTYVTRGPNGFMLSDWCSRLWSRFVQENDIRCTDGSFAKMHELRHTFATLAIKNHMDIKTLSSILGHANAAMTLNIYASADPDAKRHAALIIDSMMGSPAEIVELPRTGTEG